MVQSFEVIADKLFDDQEVAYHLVVIEMLSLEDKLDFSRMPMGEFAFSRMLREHVAAFDIDCLANAIWHFGQQIDLLASGKRNFPLPMIWKKTRPDNDLQDGHVHLWRVKLDVPTPLLRKFHQTLAQEEVLRSERFKFPILQHRFVSGRGALRAILAGYLSAQPEHLKFGYTARGKPFSLDSAPPVEFNVSHSGSLMVAAFCRHSLIGVDIEKEEARFHAIEIAERFFCEKEKQEIARQSGEAARLRVFLEIWTAKEAVLKACGFGLALELSRLEIGLAPLRVLALRCEEEAVSRASWHLVAFRPGDDYYGAVAVAASPRKLEYRDFLPCRESGPL